jgi:hypothetical protein
VEQAKRTLNLISGSFAGAAIVAVAALAAVDLGEPTSPDLAGGATLTATVFGALGLVGALVWSARAGERRSTPNRLMVAFVVRVAIAELGLLMGILGLVMTGAMLPSYVGLGFFLGSLALLATGLRRVGT